MKSIAVLTIVVVAAAFVQCQESKMKEKVKEVYNQCKEAHPISDADTEELKKGEAIPESKEVKCLLTCMLEKSSFIKDGKFSKETALMTAEGFHAEDPEAVEKAKKVIETCHAEVGEEVGEGDAACEFGFKMATCVRAEKKKVGLPVNYTK